MAGKLVTGGLAAAAAIMGVLGWRTGLAFQRGENRRVARWYFDPSARRGVRNLAFMQTAAGTAFLGAALSLTAMFLPWPGLIALLVLVGSSLFAGGLVVAIVRQFRPPERMKPEWLKAQERARSGDAGG